ncbi:CvpA family protein [Paraburkholderia caballeronis]|uniref:Membrane protein required for colicin V production n=1 Tax=Paraburkholderia caballeronis TaxID=416943 RepID=A0A1H7KTU1_9BURK|nr:CvpA family protein [Paraburkholderia caballeronis]PXW28162.1 membrane protein required for colicin V production [Paraburkholderia caballeronis]PXX03528.1 membrane protein required for colicin V production [Paraburkholderia caballeronis]RAK04272.1 membrane protein required for colicin V production [Paraburkholderia caballeronis]TDV19315.1 membrane protein required for colicin V production [Paraburkholderia caballeronis]TDV21915.1 membrane protein required for colicin V production [Paraburkh
MFTAFDYAVLAVIGLSALRGAWRGFVGEIFGLIGWIAAFIVACRFVDHVVPWIPANWPGGGLTQWLLAFALIVIGVVLVASVANALLTRLVTASGLSGVDRSLGMMFGLVRGVVLVLVLVVLGGLTELPQQNFWRDALLRPYAEQGVRELKPLLPDPLAAYVHV